MPVLNTNLLDPPSAGHANAKACSLPCPQTIEDLNEASADRPLHKVLNIPALSNLMCQEFQQVNGAMSMKPYVGSTYCWLHAAFP